MTHWSLSHHKVQGLVVVSASLFVLGLTACGSSHGNTAVANPAVSASAPKPAVTTTSSPAAAPAAPIPHNDQPSADNPCGLITEADATAALGFDPGPGHIDKSGAIFSPDGEQFCAYGDPMKFTVPVIDISAKQYPTANVARIAFKLLKQNEHASATALNPVSDYPVGYGALIKSAPSAGAYQGAGSSQVGIGRWIVTILYYHGPDDPKHSAQVVTKLAQAVVSHRP